MSHFAMLVAHQAETGGDPTGFGLASFLTLLFGIVAIAFMLGRYLRALGRPRGTFEPQEQSAVGEHSATPPTEPQP